MKTLIITGSPRTGTTGLTSLINQSKISFVSSELGMFFPKENYLNEKIQRLPLVTLQELKYKNWTAEQLRKMIHSKKYPENIKIFGDKHPDYCLNKRISKHIVEKYGSSAYFIFTNRNIFGIAYSFLKKTRKYAVDFPDKKPRWFTFDPTESIKRILEYYDNMLFMYPRIQKKIIINYENAMEDPDYVHNKLKNFLQIELPIDLIKKTYKSDEYNDWEIHLKDDEKKQIIEFLKKYQLWNNKIKAKLNIEKGFINEL